LVADEHHSKITLAAQLKLYVSIAATYDFGSRFAAKYHPKQDEKTVN
jgi:hypothetical protein